MSELIVIEKEELRELIIETIKSVLEAEEQAQHQPNNEKELLTLKEVRQMLGISYDTLKKNLDSGYFDLKPIFVYGRTRPKYARKDVESLIERLNNTTNEG